MWKTQFRQESRFASCGIRPVDKWALSNQRHCKFSSIWPSQSGRATVPQQGELQVSTGVLYCQWVDYVRRTSMFRMVRGGVRRRFTAFVAVLYAFCVLAPHAALALTHDPSTFHCLTEHELGIPHEHGGAAHAGSVHVHA